MDEELLRVRESRALTGLGVLLLPAAASAALARLALHTVWAVELVEPAGRRAPGVASVEEITRPGPAATPARGLLLIHEGAVPPPPGTRVLWRPESAESE